MKEGDSGRGRRGAPTISLLAVTCVLVAIGGSLSTNAAEPSTAALREALVEARDEGARLRASLALIDALRADGANREALAVLERVAPSMAADGSVALELRRGGLLHALGRFDDAQKVLDGLRARAAAFDAGVRAALMIEIGNLTVDRGGLADAIEAFGAAAAAAGEAGASQLLARALVNAQRARFDDKDLRGAEAQLSRIRDAIDGLPAGNERAELHVSLGELHRRAVNEFAFPVKWRADALAALMRAHHEATDPIVRGHATGFLGALYEDEGRWEEALALTSRALFFAQQANSDAQVYRWEWQAGRILRAMRRAPEAEAAYSRAASVLTMVKSNYALGARSVFDRLVAPVYTQYADVMLERTGRLSPGQEKQRVLREVRDLLETLKQAEVEDYFANECVARNRDPTGGVVAGTGNAAVIYPVFLDSRIELLIEAGGELAQFTTPVGANQATAVIRRFRVDLERVTAGDAHLEGARTLYRWLIAPAEAFLASHRIGTLVIVPEGALRTIPLAALNDGKQFLVERFAVATTPAMKLTQSLQGGALSNLLVGGVSEGVQGFAELPNVGREIDTVAAIYPARTMRDSAFQMRTVTLELESGQFSAAHFATHGEFNRDYRKSFLLTYDDKLTLSSLQRALEMRGEAPLDLLVLSACQTAAGDDRAALGLAGVAVQSGAKSALASLWSISDAATAELIAHFYEDLKAADRTKAQSLRAAQLQLLRGERFSHPSFWAPYLLIGNWL